MQLEVEPEPLGGGGLPEYSQDRATGLGSRKLPRRGSRADPEAPRRALGQADDAERCAPLPAGRARRCVDEPQHFARLAPVAIEEDHLPRLCGGSGGAFVGDRVPMGMEHPADVGRPQQRCRQRGGLTAARIRAVDMEPRATDRAGQKRAGARRPPLLAAVDENVDGDCRVDRCEGTTQAPARRQSASLATHCPGEDDAPCHAGSSILRRGRRSGKRKKRRPTAHQTLRLSGRNGAGCAADRRGSAEVKSWQEGGKVG